MIERAVRLDLVEAARKQPFEPMGGRLSFVIGDSTVKKRKLNRERVARGQGIPYATLLRRRK